MKQIKNFNEDAITSKIYFVRGEKVILDKDIASMYEIDTKVLKQAVRRNIKRFPEDFMFELTNEELENWRSQCITSNSLRSQFVTLEKGRGKHSKYLPMAFTEQGVAMLSSILKSDRAIIVNIEIMRIFVKTRGLL